MLSVLIVNWNTRELLRQCLQSFRKFPPQGDFEVIVVDNASTDNSAAMVRNDFPEIHLIESKVNTGYAAGNNLAFTAAQGEFLLTLNPDTELIDDSLGLALAKMNENPTWGAAGAKQIGTDGLTQSSVRGFPSLIGMFGDMSGLGRKKPGSKFDNYRLSGFDYNVEQIAPQPMGTFLLFRRAALEAVGDPKAPFDNSFPIFFNEVDLLYRMNKAGWPCYYLPDVKILHHGGASTKQIRKSAIWETHKCLVRYLLKHAENPIQRLGYLVIAPAIYLLAFVRAKGYSPGFRAS